MAKKKTEFSAIGFESFSQGFWNETDRACAILGAAYLDAALESLFRRCLISLKDELLEFPGPLSSFSSRICVAYSLSWIDTALYDDLNVIRGIRNDFAHSFDHELSFNDQSVADRCRNLKSATANLAGFEACARNNPHMSHAAINDMRRVFEPPKRRFQIAVESLAQVLAELAPNPSCSYIGPNLYDFCYSKSANLRITGQGHGEAPPLQSTEQSLNH